MPSPSLMDSVGHSGTHAPQAMHSSVIFIVMVVTPSKIYYCGYKSNACRALRQMTNISCLVNFVTVLQTPKTNQKSRFLPEASSSYHHEVGRDTPSGHFGIPPYTS